MLCGHVPFSGSDEECVAKKICYDDLEFDDENWEVRSKKVIDLIDKVLVKDPSKRINIDEFLKHPWFKKNMKQKMSM
jgi:serine/threonine protein kinase